MISFTFLDLFVVFYLKITIIITLICVPYQGKKREMTMDNDWLFSILSKYACSRKENLQTIISDATGWGRRIQVLKTHVHHLLSHLECLFAHCYMFRTRYTLQGNQKRCSTHAAVDSQVRTLLSGKYGRHTYA